MQQGIRSIGIIGAGEMGSALAGALSQKYDVRVAASKPRSASVTALVAASNGRIQEGDFKTCAGADITFVVVPWPALHDAAARLSSAAPKRVVSVVVPWDGDNAVPTIGRDDSAAEMLARNLPSSTVANAFTSVGAGTVREVNRYEERPTVFVTSDDRVLKDSLKGVASSIGFDAIDAGPLYAARFTEVLGFLWTSAAFEGGNGEMIAFKAVQPRG